MYIERSHEGAIGSIMSGLFMIGEETIHEMKTRHKEVYNKVIQGLLHLKQSVGENNTDVVFIKSFIQLMNSFTDSEKAILLQYYQLMGKKISEIYQSYSPSFRKSPISLMHKASCSLMNTER
jgi:hypothetical protein